VKRKKIENRKEEIGNRKEEKGHSAYGREQSA
jgi:hypothetical protein